MCQNNLIAFIICDLKKNQYMTFTLLNFFFMFFNCFDVLMLKINFFKEIIFLIYFKIKNNLKNNFNHTFK